MKKETALRNKRELDISPNLENMYTKVVAQKEPLRHMRKRTKKSP